MARVSLVQTNFTAGEISPRLVGRTDIERYTNAARKLTNAIALVHGGAKRRPGTRYAAGTKINAKRSRLIPFVVSRDAAYMLEVGDNYLRVYAAGGTYTGVELATTYNDTQLDELDYAQGADTMFLVHPKKPVRRLRRFSPTSFDLSLAPFTTTPFEEQGHYLAADVTLSLATVGAARTATASVGVFLPTDVGRFLLSGAGVGEVVGYTSPTVVTINIAVAFSGVALTSGDWYLDVSPQALVRPSIAEPVAATVNLSGSKTRAANLTLSALTGAITVTASAAIFVAGDVGKKIFAGDGIATITVYTDPTHVDATVDTGFDFTSLTHNEGGYGITADTWRTEDIGSFVRINGGLVRIEALTSASVARATIITALSFTVASPPLAWSLESSVWSVANGYPRTVTLHEQRLIAAGTDKYPQTLWGSRTAEYLDFTKGTNDDDSYSFTISSDEVNPIIYVTSLRNLVVHTYGGEFSVQGGVEKPITPTNVRVRPESTHGSRGVRPITVGKESVFVQRAGRKLRALGYRYEQDGYIAPDLTVLAEHITAGGGIESLAYQQEPDQTVWAGRGDGALLACTLDRDQSVVAWAEQFTDGAVESVATIPNGDREETWLIVKRTVNGATVRYIEILDDTWEPMLPGAAYTGYPPAPEVNVYGYTVDCGQSFDNAGGQTVFNVPHLIGKTVDIVADGAVMPQQVVPASGNVTLTRASYRTLIGLHFRTEIGLLSPEVGTGSGSAQGNSMRTSEITMRFLDTIGAQVFDGEGVEQEVPFRRFGPEILDQPPELFTGNVRIETLGWDRGKSEFSIVQDQPLPMHLLSVVRKFQVND
jgi:hypothetical protein